MFNISSPAAAPLTIGLGCQRGVSDVQIEAAIVAALQTLAQHSPSANAAGNIGASLHAGGPMAAVVKQIASIDAKAEEAGLLAFCQQQQLILRLFAAETLAAISLPSPASAAVQQRFGLDGICEAAALAAAPGAVLLLRKTIFNGIALAIAAMPTESDHAFHISRR